MSAASDERLTLTRPPSSPALGDGAARRAHLLVFEEDTCRTVALPEPGELIVGRSGDASLRIEDPAASRRHARILCSGGQVLVVDLDSHNGTLLNGQRLTCAQTLAAGDVVTIGATQLVLQREPQSTAILRILGPEALVERVELEVRRVLHVDRPATVLWAHLGAQAAAARRAREAEADGAAHPAPAPGAARARVLEALAPLLRPIDSLGFSGLDELTLVLPEVDASDDEVGPVLAALAAAAPDSRVGLATCPVDGVDAEVLLSVARAAAQRAQPGEACRPEALAVTRTVGGRAVVVLDPAMQRVYALVDRLAASELPVLIGGETGTGKELIAQALHEGSRRRAGPLRSLNCAALPESLIESELFGHVKGAFSGAISNKVGLIEATAGGTLFFDELGELPASAQAKLLRVLETRRVTRVGDVAERPVDLRIVAATHRDLGADVAAGRFREDLYYRFGAARIVLPPLRERPRELAALARVLLRDACAAQARDPLTLAPGAIAALRAHRWPGNVRELRNVLELVAATTNDALVERWHVEEALAPLRRIRASPPSAPSASESHRTSQEAEEAERSPARPAADARAQGATPDDAGAAPVTFEPIDHEVRALEALRMRQALAAAGGVKKRAAELLSMPLRTFVTKHKLYGLGQAAAPGDSPRDPAEP